MIKIRHGSDRGRTRLDWLDGRHTFSFAEYVAPEHHQFRALRVINEDVIAPGKGFGMHPHRDMEIVTVMLSGALQHRDNMGNGSVIRPGDVQRMTAGTGVVHSEWNASETESAHLLQIWLLPEKRGLTPGYEERTLDLQSRRGRLVLVASRDGRDESLTIHQDAELHRALLSKGDAVEYALAPGRHAWLQVAAGAVILNGHELRAGDGAAISEEPALRIAALNAADVLLFDLA